MLKRYIGRFKVVWKSYKQLNGVITLNIQAPLMLIDFFFQNFRKFWYLVMSLYGIIVNNHNEHLQY